MPRLSDARTVVNMVHGLGLALTLSWTYFILSRRAALAFVAAPTAVGGQGPESSLRERSSFMEEFGGFHRVGLGPIPLPRSS
ncbi:MAG: hypothetical protein WDO73_08020 [Ignavibacteriota bacterium]